MEQVQRQIALQGDLRKLITELDEGSLVVALVWVDRELVEGRRGRLRLLRGPEAPDEAVVCSGSVDLLRASLRTRLHSLPEAQLVLLRHWIEDRLMGMRRW